MLILRIKEHLHSTSHQLYKDTNFNNLFSRLSRGHQTKNKIMEIEKQEITSTRKDSRAPRGIGNHLESAVGIEMSTAISQL